MINNQNNNSTAILIKILRIFGLVLVFATTLFLLGACGTTPGERTTPIKRTVPVAKSGDLPVPTGAVESVVLVQGAEFPFSAIGRLNVAGEGYCTAALIASDVILAPASCLYNWTVGTWRGAVELFFQAGYHKEVARGNSKIAAFATPAQFKPGKFFNLASAQYDMALLRLEIPVGKKTGWLGMRWFDAQFQNDLFDRVAVVHHMGYPRSRRFVQSVETGCNRVSRDCGSPENLVGLRAFTEIGGRFYALATRTYLANRRVKTEFEAIMADLLQKIDKQKLAGFEPTPVPPQPKMTAVSLLEHLGYLPPQVEPYKQEQINRATELFQRHQGIRSDGRITIKLLARLLREVARRGTPVS